ncbi:MAG: WcaI family glycosyltransferase [Alphaproteobacteria bacterium]
MKILIYGLNFAPELTGIGRFTGDMAGWLAARGHTVRAVAAPPYYPAWKVSVGYARWWWRTENVNGVRVTRCPLYVPSKATGLRRVLHLVSFALTSAAPAKLSGLFWRPDVVLVIQPTAFVAPAGLAAALFGRALSWLHIQDFEFDAAFDLHFLPKFLAAPARASERWLLRRFNTVSTISPRMADRLSGKGVAADRIVEFPNWVDTRRIHPDADGASFRAEIGIEPGAVVALYSGNIGEKQGIDQIASAVQAVVAARRDDDPPVQFVVAGAGAGRDMIESAMQTHGLDDRLLKLLPLQPEEKLPALLAMADIHLLPQKAEAADLVMPSKLGGMLSSGRPVVASADPGTQIARMVASCGTVVAPADGPAMGAAVMDLVRDRDTRLRLGKAARAAAESEWERDAVLRRFEEALELRVAAHKGGKTS